MRHACTNTHTCTLKQTMRPIPEYTCHAYACHAYACYATGKTGKTVARILTLPETNMANHNHESSAGYHMLIATPCVHCKSMQPAQR